MIDVENLTIKQLKEIQAMGTSKKNESFFAVGKCYLIRTVTFTYAGTIKALNDSEILLENCDWIADTGRFSNNLKDCNFSEVEPFIGDVILQKTALVDATIISKTPRVQK